MQTLERLALTSLLIFIQPVKLIASVACVGGFVIYDVLCEFGRDLRAIWKRA